MKTTIVEKQFHATWFGYSLISYLRDTYKTPQISAAGIICFSCKYVILNK